MMFDMGNIELTFRTCTSLTFSPYIKNNQKRRLTLFNCQQLPYTRST